MRFENSAPALSQSEHGFEKDRDAYCQTALISDRPIGLLRAKK